MGRLISLADQEAIANDLHQSRRKCQPKLTLEALEAKTGISKSKLSRFERGQGRLRAEELACLVQAVKGINAQLVLWIDEGDEHLM